MEALLVLVIALVVSVAYRWVSHWREIIQHERDRAWHMSHGLPDRD